MGIMRGKGNARKDSLFTYFFMFVLIGGGIALLYFAGFSFTGFAVFNQGSSSDFNQGTYSSAVWNGSAVVLSGNNLTGSYVSKVFDAGANSTWNNLTWQGGIPSVEFLFAVDGSGAVYKSINQGVSWTQTVSNYGRTTDTIYMFSDSSYLYILSNANREVWRSSDLGVSFSVVNNLFADNNLFVGWKDSSSNLFAVDGSGDVYKSTNFGVSWSLQGDFNGIATNNAYGIAINSNGIFIVDGSGDVFRSVNQGVSWTTQNSDYGGGAGTDGMASDGTSLYILLNKQIYKSTNDAVTWNIVNNSFTPYSQDGLTITSDSSGNLYILDGNGRVFKSTNTGVSWTEIGDFNGVATNNPKGFTNLIQPTNLSFQVRNCSSPNCADGNWQSVNLGNINLTGRYFQYLVNFTTPDSVKSPSLSNITIDYSLINQAPSIIIILPQEGNTYGYNESLALNFTVSDPDGNLQSCWYNINGGVNASIANCLNTTFSVSGSGSYALNLYANDSYGLVSFDSVSFSVQLGAPTITLSSPINTYLSSGNSVQFKYTPQDIDLSICELWANFAGFWSLNQTHTSPSNNVENTFTLNLADGGYMWNVRCNDTVGNSAFNGNKTFTVDTLRPIITLSEPSGTKTSRNNISLAFSILDANLESCWYNVYRGETQELSNTSIDCSAGTSGFNVTVDADFILNFYANDSAGNLNSTNSSFTVDTSAPPSGGGGSPGGGGGSSGGSVISKKPSIEVGTISSIVVTEGGVKKISNWKVKNTGTSFLNTCNFKSQGVNAGWITHAETKGLAAGEEYTFVFDVNIPEGIEEGDYGLEVLVDCKEVNKTSSFLVEVKGKQLDFKLVNVERVDKGNVSVKYFIEELVGEDHSIELQFLIFDLGNKKEAEVREIRIISADSNEEFETIIPIRENLEGELSLLVNLNSETYSAFVQENIVLGKGVSGFSVLGNGNNRNLIMSFVLIALFSVFSFFIVRKIRGHKKTIRHKQVREKYAYLLSPTYEF